MNQNDHMMYNWICLPSRIGGLRYIPTTEPQFSDCDQRMFTRIENNIGFPLCVENAIHGHAPLVHNGPSVRKSHTELIEDSVSRNVMRILEIGVNVYKKPLLSTTRAILKTKKDDCIYLGLDVKDKSVVDDSSKNIHTMAINSSSRVEVRRKMLELGMLTIDLLLIDGDHSIDMAINDWCFSEFLSPFGAVIIHDTNVHIGPKAVFDAIDNMSFEKRLVGATMTKGKFPVYGIGIARRLF